MTIQKINNLSLEPTWQILHWFDRQFLEKFVTKVTVLPDVCPAGILPNGTISHVDIDWLNNYQFREVMSDIGCAMSVAEVNPVLPSDRRKVWNDFFRRLKKLNKTILGSGNHFIDLCENQDGRLFLLVHVGSRMSSAEKDQFRFDRDYQLYLNRASENHQEIWNIARQTFGPIGTPVHVAHDTVEVFGPEMEIRKGVTHSPAGSPFIISSSFDDIITVGVTTDSVAQIQNSVSHGTGRIRSRSDAKHIIIDQQAIRNKLIIPDDLEDHSWRLESSEHYRRSEAVLSVMQPYLTVQHELKPIAFMGGF